MLDDKFICMILDLLKYVGGLEIRLKMWIMIEEDDYYWKIWMEEKLYYMMVY